MQAAPRTPTALILSSLSLFTLEQEVMCKTAILMHSLCYKYASPLLNSSLPLSVEPKGLTPGVKPQCSY